MARNRLKEIAAHFHVFDRSQYQDRRREFLARHVDLSSARGLEFGAFDLPTVPSELGECAVADMRSEIRLARDFDVPVESVLTVDCVVEPGLAAYRQIGLRFDYVILCHVLEHIPDVITMMNDLCQLLVPGGTLFIALPDKRETLDAARPSTPLARLVERQYDRTNRPTLTELAEFSLAWHEDFRKQYKESMKEFFHAMRSHQLFGVPDIHCNVWRDEEFFEQVHELIRGKYLPDLQVIATQPTRKPFNEFYVALRRGVDSGKDTKRRAPTEEPAVFYRTCGFCGYGQFKVWKRLHSPFPEQLYGDTPPEPDLGRQLSLQYLTCRECDLTQINPLPHFDLVDRHRFSTPHAIDLDEAGIEALIEDRRRVARIISEQHDFDRYRQTGRLLDVSCGLGIALAWLRDERGWDVRGVEPARELVEFASDRFGLEVANGIVQDLPDAPGSFDVIMIDSSLQCVFDPLETLMACHRLLREGGCLFVQVPNRDGLGTEWLDQNVHWGHWFFYTPATLLRILDRIGFESERLLAIQNPIDPRVREHAASDLTMREEDLQVQLLSADDIEEAFAQGRRPRADFFGLSVRKRSAAPRSEDRDASPEWLTNISRASRRPRHCVAIDPETSVRWPWEEEPEEERASD